MSDKRIGHFLAFLGSLATAVLPAWVDPTQTWPARVALTIVTGLLLTVKTDKLVTHRNALFGALSVVGVVVAAVYGKFSAGSAGFAVGGFVLAVIAQLRIAFAAKLPPSSVVVLIAWASLCASHVRADVNDPATGGCLARNNDAGYNADGSVRTPATCKVSAQLSMLAPTAVIDLKTGDALAGANAAALGPCYGLTYQPASWYASGADVCLTVRVASGQPNQYTGALMFHTARWGSLGIGTQGTQVDGRLRWHGLGVIALKLPVL